MKYVAEHDTFRSDFRITTQDKLDEGAATPRTGGDQLAPSAGVVTTRSSIKVEALRR